MRVCVCVCVCVRERERVCVCVCVCEYIAHTWPTCGRVCVRARERDRERDSVCMCVRVCEREGEKICVCVCPVLGCGVQGQAPAPASTSRTLGPPEGLGMRVWGEGFKV